MPDINLNINVTVDKPAAKETWDGGVVAGVLVKSDDERRYTLTVAYPVNKPDVGKARDGFRDFAGATAVEDAAWDYMLKSRKVGMWHEDGTDGAGDLVESYIYRGPDWKLTAADGSEQVIKAGDWLLGIRWPAETYQLIKEGKATGMSPQGKAKRRNPSPADLANLRKQRA